ncbi:sigma-54-dependent Fis family transcriptional regulator [Ruixingdingia sedimenti]|uniref:Sigma 54-interacting transcriptional regulator n=1 Tax=Ruixingdingia sedimenti TaxID=3073604 RepID=A0ABU1F9D7_9RHOB|nr:sigma 54-interacting transcriptional regulator [Xinfangfangia sp. LG-4]MDR5653494.1 sigma 54-interacting transcriptional regulator [Xinfangfangia sp. LG-4]
MRSEIEKLTQRSGQGALPLPRLVEESWRRCLEDYHLAPDVQRVADVMTSAELREAHDRHEPMIRFASPELDRLFRWLGGEECLVSLGSPEAVKLLYRCDNRFLGDLSAVGVLPGSIWDEAVQGTNGMGTCLKVGGAVSILGGQHFSSRLAKLTCIATPILGAGGAVVGLVNITSMRPTDAEMAQTLREAVRRTAWRIEHKTFALRHAGLRVFSLSDTAEGDDPAAEPQLALDDNGRIADVTSTTAILLQRDRAALIGADLDDFLQGGWPAGRGAPGRIRLADGRSLFLRPMARTGGSRARPDRGRAEHLLFDETFTQALQRTSAMLAEGLPVIVKGETGTGKSVLARMTGRRTDRPESGVVVLNCAMPEEEAEPLLRRLDWISDALLVLDRAEDMSPELQRRLTQLLSEDDLLARRNLDLVSLSTQDLAERVAAGSFRGDLFHRLNGATVALAPLRALPGLQQRLLDVLGQEAAMRGLARPEIEEMAQLVLYSHHWPGNLRELRNAARHALVLAGGGPIRLAHLPEAIVDRIAHDNLRARSQAERTRIEAALRHNGGNVSATARYLGLSRATLYRKLGGKKRGA